MTQERTPAGRTLRRWQRGLLALGGGLLLAVWGLACWLEPDPRGYGTHEQLGLAPCSFKRLTGWRCPSCGMTTSFAYLARAQPVRALKANAAGCFLAVVSLVLVPWCWTSCLHGRWIGVKAPERALVRLVLGLVAVSLIGWGAHLLLDANAAGISQQAGF